ncbi:response regulator receiver protein [Granulicella rosea]|uniref:Response regulator receiver protein n=1 Tax=Granulicella rosea TaxID=474952 RepID=A0A239H512_9BACT|nr:response regulator [Granulicella rosea]SNS75344.1 response regulator receiver protein [Granulicella rosea]
MRILIVDDSTVMRKVVERALRQAGMEIAECLQAANGVEALEVLRATNGDLDLVLSDINMPVMDGLLFLEKRAEEKLAMNVPVVMITTEGGAAAVLRAIAAGAKGYICKPFTTDQVKLRILPVLNSASAVR